MKKNVIGAFISTFIFCEAFWILLTMSFAPREIILGIIVSAMAAFFSSKVFIHEKPFFLYAPIRLFRLLYYFCIVFMGELIKANIDVAKRALSPKISVNPGIVKISTETKSDYEQAMLANSITLTPGTITLDVTEEENNTYLYVHWIDVVESDREKAGEIIKGKMEKHIRRIWE